MATIACTDSSLISAFNSLYFGFDLFLLRSLCSKSCTDLKNSCACIMEYALEYSEVKKVYVLLLVAWELDWDFFDGFF